MLCPWKEPGTKGNCQVVSPCLSLPSTCPTISRFPGKSPMGRPLPHATRTLSPYPLARGAVDCLQTVSFSFSCSQGDGGDLWSVLSMEPRASSKWVSSAGAYDLASGGSLVCLCLWLNTFHGSSRRQRRRGKPTASQEPGQALCLLLPRTPYCYAWDLKCCLLPCVPAINQITGLWTHPFFFSPFFFLLSHPYKASREHLLWVSLYTRPWKLDVDVSLPHLTV